MSDQAAPKRWTVLELINWTRDYLERQGVDQPRLAAEMLLAHVLGCKRLELYTRFDFEPTPAQRDAYRELVRRAAQHEPIAYLVGHREFYSLDFLVSPAVLIPRPETELLAQQAIEFLKAGLAVPRYWDVCTGSGCVAVAVAKNVPTASVLASDISEAALDVARRNADRHGLAERVALVQADLLNLPPDLDHLAPFDAITANPPYVTDAQMAELPPDVRHEPLQALQAGPAGLDAIDPILRQAPDHLRPGGLLAMEIGFGQADAVWDLVQAVDRYERASFVKDAAGIDRVLVAWRRGA